MPGYIQGNLAVERKPSARVKVKETKKIVTRSKTLPVQEKLLYLFTVIVCVVVAGVIIWRYAQIYEMNTHIQQIERDIRNLEAENSALKHKVETMSNPDFMMQKAKELGMVPATDNQISRINSVKPAPPPASSSKAEANATTPKTSP